MSGTALKPCSCASCAAQTDACHCGIACSMVCQHKGADATLCGFQEYASPSVPPKMYRRQSIGGASSAQGYANPGCHDASGPTTNFSWTGTYHFDAMSCAETNTQVEKINGVFYQTGPKDFQPSNSGNAVLTTDPTSKTWNYPGTCSDQNQTWTGQTTCILDDEDTEDDAEARAMADIMSWAACSACDATCTRYRIGTPRAAGEFFFSFNFVQTQISWTAVIGKTYKVTAKFYSRVLGSGGPFLFFGQEEVTVIADVVDETSPWIDVQYPGDGLEAIAGVCTVELIP